MCDTIVALPGATSERVVLFGKNSDRERNEAQAVEYFPGKAYPADAKVACTYLTIPQVAHTNAVLLSRPFWIWGAEMGANEHGVVIGNEGLLARIAAPEPEALIGMDLIRLALERAKTAAEALDVMTTLLGSYGQGGNCGHQTPTFYHNGFIIADPAEAFVLETLGREWLIERVGGVRAISNTYSIAHPERLSQGLDAALRSLGSPAVAPGGYAEVIADPHQQHIGYAEARRARATELLRANEGHLTVATMMGVLRDHGPGDKAAGPWRPRTGIQRTLCTHAGDTQFRGQTVGSMVSEIRRTDSVHWVTGTAAPCISIYKPVLLNSPLPFQGPTPTGQFDAQTLWWRHEKWHRTVLLGDFPQFLNAIRAERDTLEAQFQSRITVVLDGGNASERARVIADCWREATATEDRWAASLPNGGSPDDELYRSAWSEMNRLAGIDGPSASARS